MRSRATGPAALLLPVAMAIPAAAQAAPQLAVTPYVWAPIIEGSMALGPFNIPIRVAPADLASGVKFGGMVYGEALGPGGAKLFGQIIGADFARSAFRPLLNLDVRARVISVEAGAGQPVRWGRVTLTPFAGGRYTWLEGSFSGPIGALNAHRGWGEILVGAEAEYRLGARVALHARYDATLAGPRGSDNRDAMAGASYRLSPHLALVGGYRKSRQRIEASAGNPLAFRLRANGPLIGLRIQ